MIFWRRNDNELRFLEDLQKTILVRMLWIIYLSTTRCRCCCCTFDNLKSTNRAGIRIDELANNDPSKGQNTIISTFVIVSKAISISVILL